MAIVAALKKDAKYTPSITARQLLWCWLPWNLLAHTPCSLF